MATALLALGSNQGDRAATLAAAMASLREEGHEVVAVSRWRETAPVGGPAGQPSYLNGAALLRTDRPPLELLESLQRLELARGRQRSERWGARTLDLDLLLYGQLVLDTPALTLPHPRMAWRRFVVEPAAEIAPTLVHPLLGWTMSELWSHLNQSPRYVAITATQRGDATAVARRLAARAKVDLILAENVPTPTPWHGRPHHLAGDAASQKVEFLLQRAAALLGLLRQRRNSPRWLVSDFWLGEIRAEAMTWLDSSSLRIFDRQWASLGIAPRLLVHVDRAPAHAEPISERDVLRRQALLAEAGRPGQGPVLRCSGGDGDAAVAEIEAAVAAMS